MAASPAASTVSSVLPENETANTSEPASHEVGQVVGLHHGDGNGDEGPRHRHHDVAGEPAATHAEDHHVLDVLALGQAVEAVGGLHGGGHLLGQPGGDLEHAQGVEAPSGTITRARRRHLAPDLSVAHHVRRRPRTVTAAAIEGGRDGLGLGRP